MTFREALNRGKLYLMECGIEEYELDAWLLFEHVTGINKAMYYVKDREELPEDQERKYQEMLHRRGEHIPLQHLTGVQEFMGYSFRVNGNVLIPRQDTEILVEDADAFCHVMEGQGRNIRILDLCTGSGCILLSLMKMDSHGSRSGIGSDLSEEALRIARENQKILEVSKEKAAFIKSDLFEEITGRFDMIVSNPPYIRTKEIEKLQEEVRLHDPFQALDGKEDGLYFYQRITEKASDFLNDEGRLIFEIGYDQGEAVSAMMKDAGFDSVYVKKDLAGLDRVVGGVYNRAREN